MSIPIDPAQFAAICDPLPDALLLLDSRGNILALNQSARRRFPALRAGDHLSCCIHESAESLARILKTWRRAASPTPSTLHSRLDPERQPMRCEGAAVAQGQAIVLRCRTREQATKAFSVLNEEILKLQHANHALRHDREYLAQRVSERTQTIRESERRLRGILEALAEAVICFDSAGLVLSTNVAADQLFGYARGDLTGLRLSDVLPDPAVAEAAAAGHYTGTMEARASYRDGSDFPVELKVRELLLQGEVVFTALIADITERKAYLHHLRRLAERDSLTSLYNRRYFSEESARQAAVEAADEAYGDAVLFIDLDNFKYVNDELGHGAGDQVLKEVAGLLQGEVRSGDLLARIGGDEFAVLLCNAGEDAAECIAERIRSSLERYVYHGPEGQVDVGCSIGVSRRAGSIPPEQALKQAEFACRQAKARGRNRVWHFTASDAAAAATDVHEMGWVRRLKRALAEDLFQLHVQPIVRTADGHVDVEEVLLRLADDGDNLTMPNAFLPAAERFGLMPDIDRWVVRHAVRAAGRSGRNLSVNLSATTLADADLPQYIADEISAAGAKPVQLVFEITETAAVSNLTRTAGLLAELRKLGCRTALDDFGAGMSSFAYLRALPVDWLKIDGRFVRELATNAIDRAMVKAMQDIARTMGKTTVAEFVENEASMNILCELGVDLAQGYHLGRPVPMIMQASPDDEAESEATLSQQR